MLKLCTNIELKLQITRKYISQQFLNFTRYNLVYYKKKNFQSKVHVVLTKEKELKVLKIWKNIQIKYCRY